MKNRVKRKKSEKRKITRLNYRCFHHQRQALSFRVQLNAFILIILALFSKLFDKIKTVSRTVSLETAKIRFLDVRSNLITAKRVISQILRNS